MYTLEFIFSYLKSAYIFPASALFLPSCVFICTFPSGSFTVRSEYAARSCSQTGSGWRAASLQNHDAFKIHERLSRQARQSITIIASLTQVEKDISVNQRSAKAISTSIFCWEIASIKEITGWYHSYYMLNIS